MIYLLHDCNTHNTHRITNSVASVIGLATWSDTGEWKRGLTEEVGITEHVDVLNDEPQQSHGRINDVKLARLRPDRIETIVNCTHTHTRLMALFPGLPG